MLRNAEVRPHASKQAHLGDRLPAQLAPPPRARGPAFAAAAGAAALLLRDEADALARAS
jgi:hypothetical protein